MTILSRLLDEMQLPIDKAIFNNGLHTRVQLAVPEVNGVVS